MTARPPYHPPQLKHLPDLEGARAHLNNALGPLQLLLEMGDLSTVGAGDPVFDAVTGAIARMEKAVACLNWSEDLCAAGEAFTRNPLSTQPHADIAGAANVLRLLRAALFGTWETPAQPHALAGVVETVAGPMVLCRCGGKFPTLGSFLDHQAGA